MTEIGEFAFYHCSELHDVYCYAEKVPSTGSDAFGIYKKYATLHVPAASVKRYVAEYPWKGFGKIVALTPEETGIDELKGENGKRENCRLRPLRSPCAEGAEGYIYPEWQGEG